MPENLWELSRVGDWPGHLAGAAAAVAFVTPDASRPGERESIAFDRGQCDQNMMLAAMRAGDDLGVARVAPRKRRKMLRAKEQG